MKFSSKYRNVLYLYYYEGYSTNEIANILNKKYNTIKSHLIRARKLLKKKIGDVFMNRFDEFKQIKTPANWIDDVAAYNFISSNKIIIIKVKYILVIISIVIAIAVSTDGVTYAIYELFRTWLTKQLGENMKVRDVIEILDKTVRVEN